MSVAAVVLAGGASTRMGSPKALLRYRGRSFVACAVELASAAGCAPIVVVTGAQPLAGEPLAPAVCVHNERWQLGQLSSLQRGLAALQGEPAAQPGAGVPAAQRGLAALQGEPAAQRCAAVPAAQRGLAALQGEPGAAVPPIAPISGLLVLTVDRPHLLPATVVALVAAFRGAPDCVWQPGHAGRRGHPLIYPAALLSALAAVPPDSDPRELLRSRSDLRRTLAVDDPAIFDNLDTPRDLARLR